jgi:uncharacterized protein (DUF885 family)
MSPSKEPSAGRGAELREFLDTEWKEWLAESPETATAVGFPGHDHRWTDDSSEGIERRGRHLSASLERIGRFDRASLPEDERLNYDLYREMLESARDGLRFGFDPQPLRGTGPRNLWMPMTQLDGIHVLAPETLDIQPRGTRTELERYVARLEALPAALACHYKMRFCFISRMARCSPWPGTRFPVATCTMQLLTAKWTTSRSNSSTCRRP